MVFKELREDIAAYMERDPAAKSSLEIVLCYPGFHALIFHKMAHWLWARRLYLAGRFVSYIGRFITGIEIHPGAEIGQRFVIDHGTGVVIGETAVIGDDVTLYHDVTLGGTAPSVDSAAQVGRKRHPTLEDGVIVGSGAQILGPIVIGSHARVGANSVVTKDVPSSVTAVGVPARAVMPRDRGKAHEFHAYGTPSGECPDPVLQTIEALRQQVTALSQRVEELETEADTNSDAAKENTRRKQAG
jgi:serine O-acetyltransferase